MVTSLGDKVDDVLKVLTQKGIQRELAKEALEVAKEHGRFTIFALVDALTRIAGRIHNAGDRTEADSRVASLLELVAK